MADSRCIWRAASITSRSSSTPQSTRDQPVSTQQTYALLTQQPQSCAGLQSGRGAKIPPKALTRSFAKRFGTSGWKPMERVSHKVETALTDLAWQHWTELGVSGWRLRERQRPAEVDVAIDPEPLIFLTAAVAGIDPRLRDEAIDWCVTFGRYIS